MDCLSFELILMGTVWMYLTFVKVKHEWYRDLILVENNRCHRNCWIPYKTQANRNLKQVEIVKYYDTLESSRNFERDSRGRQQFGRNTNTTWTESAQHLEAFWQSTNYTWVGASNSSLRPNAFEHNHKTGVDCVEGQRDTICVKLICDTHIWCGLHTYIWHTFTVYDGYKNVLIFILGQVKICRFLYSGSWQCSERIR